MNPGVEWSVDGVTVPLLWSDISMSAPGGFGNMGQAVVPQNSWPHTAGVFSIVTGTRTDGPVLYVGEVTGPPHVYQGLVYLQVQGLKAQLDRRRGRRLYQSRDLSKLVLGTSDPHTGGAYFSGVGDDLFSVGIADGVLQLSRPAGSYASGDEMGVIFWAKGQNIYRLAFDIDRTATMINFEVRLLTGMGPAGALTAEGVSYGLSGTTQINVEHTLSIVGDMVAISIRSTSATSPTVDQKAVVRNLRINDRRVGAADAFTLSQLSEDLASEFGWDDLSPSSADNTLPLDWEGDWSGALTEVATRCDCTWLILPPMPESQSHAGLYLGPWGRQTWHIRGADLSDLQPQLRYSDVAVAYETSAGVPVESVVKADPDPYGGDFEVVWPPGGAFVLGDRQYDSAVADRAAAMLADYWSQPRAAGQIEVARVWNESGEAHPWDIDAGDLVELGEFESLGAPLPAQRVIEVAKRVDGTSMISVGEATSMDALLADIQPLETFSQLERGGREPRQKKNPAIVPDFGKKGFPWWWDHRRRRGRRRRR